LHISLPDNVLNLMLSLNEKDLDELHEALQGLEARLPFL
jgi:hypothetical protein